MSGFRVGDTVRVTGRNGSTEGMMEVGFVSVVDRNGGVRGTDGVSWMTEGGFHTFELVAPSAPSPTPCALPAISPTEANIRAALEGLQDVDAYGAEDARWNLVGMLEDLFGTTATIRKVVEYSRG